MSSKIKYILSFLLFAPAYLLLYTAIHEGGHAIIALIYGGKIDNFVLGFNAYVSHHGTTFTVFGAALHDAAGMLLPTILGIIAICFYSNKIKSISYHICYLLVYISLPGSILSWVGIPIISMFAQPPQGDDVTKFLSVTGFHPLLVSLGAILLMGLLVFLAYRKGIYRKAKEIFAVFKADT